MKKWIMPLMVICMVGIVYGAPTITWNAPGTGSGNAVSGSTKIRISLSGDFGGNWSAGDASFYFSSTGSAGSWSELGDSTESSCMDTINCTSFNYTWVTNPFSDAKQYYLRARIFNFSLDNATGANATDLSLVWISNTNPTVSISTAANTRLATTGDNTQVSAAVKNTSSAILYLGSNYYTMTCTANSTPCTYTISTKGDPADGIYSTYVVASDGIDTTRSTSVDLEVRNYDHGGVSYEGATIDAQQAQQAGLIQSTTPPPTNQNNKLFVYGAIAILLWMVFKKR